MNKQIYVCPDCDRAEIEFKEIKREGIIFFCCYCRKDFLVKDKKAGYIRNRIVSLKRDFPAVEEI
ncbi:hypothetical protein KKD72_01310 [Patescibacteria group bacterium]|nr:hypothetical protein [Patescibacteria group bacterium]